MPREDAQFKPGWKGGPGAPKGPRLSTRILKWLDKHAEDEEALMIALIALGTGKRRLLKDDQEDDGIRKPDLDWFKELRELIQGKTPERTIVSKTQDEPELSSDDVDARIAAHTAYLKADSKVESGGIRSGSEQGEVGQSETPEPPEPEVA